MIEERFEEKKVFIQRDVYTKYFIHTAKMKGYTKFVYIPPIWNDMRSIADIPKLSEIAFGTI